MSPELLDPESQDHHQTKHSDCYALGMVMYEVLSGQVPFYRHANLVIPWKVVGGYRPERPQGAEGMWFTDDVWGLLERCWVPQPGDRPSIEGVLQRLEKISESWTPPPPSLASPPTSSSLTRKFSDTTTMESMDQSVVSSPSQTVSLQPPEQPDIDEPARIFNRVGRTSIFGGLWYSFCPPPDPAELSWGTHTSSCKESIVHAGSPERRHR